MHITDSQHCESLRSLPSHYWPPVFHGLGVDPSFRPSLNIQHFVSLLQAVDDHSSDASLRTQNGKKRAASPTPLPALRLFKRVKTALTAVCTWDNLPELAYPPLYRHTRSFNDSDLIPVFRHVAEIQYTNSHSVPAGNHANDVYAKDLGWIQEEKFLTQTLDALRGSLSEPKTIDLGKVDFAEYQRRLIVVSQLLRKPTEMDRWLFLLPSFNQEEFDLESHDFASQTVGDLMQAAYILKLADRATMEGHLKLILLPPGDSGDAQHTLPFRLQLETHISLITPSIFQPIPPNRIKKKIAEIEDAQRRFLVHLYPVNAPTPISFDGVINVPFFYSILGPAPPLQSKLAQDAMQPDELLPCLLPFQRRSVAWMLDREGLTVTATGEIVPKATVTEFNFWDKIEEGNQTWYLHRLTGISSPTPPMELRVLGGILAEEPGLGKTLEIIALILLNPAPDRKPSVKRWDPNAQLEVKEIKVNDQYLFVRIGLTCEHQSTLIVTPPALASQWVDELAAHAPTLKVLIYEGWAKVKVPIMEGEVEAERLRRLRAKGKGKAKATKKVAKSKRQPRLKAANAKGSKNKTAADLNDCMDVDEGQQIAGDDDEVMDWCTYVNTFDVVITTYQVLRQDFNVARPVPVRPRREDVVYSNVECPRSPLVMCEWNRVVMDEVQMVGGGKTELRMFYLILESILLTESFFQRYGVADPTAIFLCCFWDACTSANF